MTSEQRPPWVIVMHLPDDVLPIDAQIDAPFGTRATAFCSEAAEKILAARDAALAEDDPS